MNTGAWTLYTVTTLERLESGDLFNLLSSVESSEINFVVGCRGFDTGNLVSLGNYEIRALSLPYKISLSAARNRLLSELPPATDSAVAFPDDDSYYINGFSFSQASKLLQLNDYLIGSVVEDPMKLQTRQCSITRQNLGEVLKFVCSANIFIGAGRIEGFRFDENLGLGTNLKSGEDLDLFLWLFSKYKNGRYDMNFALIHPNKGKNLEYFNGGLVALHKYRSEISGMRWRVLRRMVHGLFFLSKKQFDKRQYFHISRKMFCGYRFRND